jgi:ribonucleoside-triphosphate reductase
MQVIKRNGTIENFDENKIYQAIAKAFIASNEVGGDIPAASRTVVRFVTDKLKRYEKIPVESIQDIIQQEMVELGYGKTAIAFAVYREKHKELRLIKDRADYIEAYSTSNENAATSSEIDGNANIQNKNVATLEAELYKTFNTDVSRYRIVKKLKELYGADAPDYIKDLNSKAIYKHDEGSAPAIKPYTYSAKEVLEVRYKGNNLLIPFDLLYSLIEEPEVLVDEKQKVYQKYPENLEVKQDGESFVGVTVITKKFRHRKLIRVKTSFGEDVVVTDNHPMIVDKQNINNTIEAIHSIGQKQFKTNTKLIFSNNTKLSLDRFLNFEQFEDYLLVNKSSVKKVIGLNRDFGYFVGFFVGDGGYNNTHGYIDISQKDVRVLHKLNNIIFNTFGFVGKIIYKHGNSNCFVLTFSNKALTHTLCDYFKIQDKAWNKTLPINILDTNEEFAKGVLEGLIDSDGTVNKAQLSIRLSSRAAILQTTALLRHFGYSVGNTIQSLPFNNNQSYKTNYTLWGVNCSKRAGCAILNRSFKFNKIDECLNTSKYHVDGEAKITSNEMIEDRSYFYQLNEYIYDITTVSHTFSLNNLLVHNCVAVNLYPFMQRGTATLDRLGTKAPQNLDSFTGQFGNLAFLLSSQFQGAIAFGEFFNVIAYYCAKEWGEFFYKNDSEISQWSKAKSKTISDMIEQAFQNIVYTINQPAGNRSYQSPFTNISYYDKNYWDALFADFVYPDGTKPDWEAVDYLQKKFMRWFNAERQKCLLTFPVETVAMLSDGNDIIDKDYKEFVAEMYAAGHSFFTYISDNADSLSSCCRLRNKLEKSAFSFTSGLTGVATGSKSVITLNLNRIIQDFMRKNNRIDGEYDLDELKRYISDILSRVYKYHTAYNELLWDLYDNNMMPVYSEGYIALNQQFLTIGINGLNEAAEFLGLKINDNKSYQDFCNLITSTIGEQNRLHENTTNKHHLKFNCEFVPAESLAVRNYQWDKEDGYKVPEDRNCYNSYFYKPDDNSVSVLEKFRLHGKKYVESLDGGVALHCNLEEHLSKEQYRKLIEYAVKEGTNYFTFNVPNSQCAKCGNISKHKLSRCPQCGSDKITWWTRIIGYLRPVSNFSKGRRIEAGKRIYSQIIE